MLTVSTTEDFSTWFRSLGDRAAEEVAIGIELIETMGPERSPPASSELLLWYQSPSESARFERAYGADMVAFAARARRVVAHLASDAIQRRIAQLSDARAERVQSSVARIRAHARRWRSGLGGRNGRNQRALQEVMSDYREALEALELSEPAPAAPEQTLRQLEVLACEPGIRVLYGVDPAHARALVILGETLDQRAYGPSVRRALSVWAQFLSSGAEVHTLEAGSSK